MRSLHDTLEVSKRTLGCNNISISLRICTPNERFHSFTSLGSANSALGLWSEKHTNVFNKTDLSFLSRQIQHRPKAPRITNFCTVQLSQSCSVCRVHGICRQSMERMFAHITLTLVPINSSDSISISNSGFFRPSWKTSFGGVNPFVNGHTPSVATSQYRITSPRSRARISGVSET